MKIQQTLPLETKQKMALECYQSKLLIHHPPNVSHQNEIVNCPMCNKIIKGRGSMMSHFRWKHLPKYYDQAYCIKHKCRMCHFGGNRNTYFCGYCAKIRQKWSGTNIEGLK